MPNEIAQSIGQAMSDVEKQIKSSTVAELIGLLNNKTLQVEILNKNLRLFDNQIAQNENLRNISRNEAFNEYQDTSLNFFHISNEMATLEQYENQLQNKILELYQLLVTIRQQLTGETITYQIAVGSGGTQKAYLIEGTFTFEELKSYLFIERRSSGYSLRINLIQKQMRELKNNNKNNNNNNNNNIQQYNRTKSNIDNILYQKLFDYYNANTTLGKQGQKNKKKKHLASVGNRGNLYQVYRYFLQIKGKGLDYIPTSREIQAVFNRVLAGGGKGGSFLTGGDVLQEQDKANLGSSATFLNYDTVINQSKDLIKALQRFKDANDSSDIINILTRKRAGNKILDTARKEAIEKIKAALQKMRK